MNRIRMCGLHQVAYIGQCKKCEAESTAEAKREEEELHEQKTDCKNSEK